MGGYGDVLLTEKAAILVSQESSSDSNPIPHLASCAGSGPLQRRRRAATRRLHHVRHDEEQRTSRSCAGRVVDTAVRLLVMPPNCFLQAWCTRVNCSSFSTHLHGGAGMCACTQGRARNGRSLCTLW